LNVLSLGGTEFIGPFVVKQLVAEGHAVTVFHRGVTEPELPPEIRHIHGDRSDLPRFASQLRSLQADVVIDMRSMVEAQAISVVGVLAGHIERAVVISSMDVYRGYDVLRGRDDNIQPVPFSEKQDLRTHLFPYRTEELHKPGDPQQWLDDYDKILVERAFLNEPRLRATVLRLPAVYGPGDDQHLASYLPRIAIPAPYSTVNCWSSSRS
jgi:nucleoside-diphosphate-sugar epimerase